MGAERFAGPQNAVHRIIRILRGVIPGRDNQDLSQIVLKSRHLFLSTSRVPVTGIFHYPGQAEVPGAR